MQRRKKMKRKIAVLLTCLLVVLGTTSFAVTFTDLTNEHWAYEYISTLADSGVINGYPDGSYLPEGTISRAEFLKLVIAASLPEGVDIKEAPMTFDHWAGQYLYVAETYGIVQRRAITLENIDEPITRIEMALMISKADVMLKFNSLNTEKEITFNDIDEMTSEEVRWLTHAVNRGFIEGYPDNTFGTKLNMTRAEAATVIFRYTK